MFGLEGEGFVDDAFERREGGDALRGGREGLEPPGGVGRLDRYAPRMAAKVRDVVGHGIEVFGAEGRESFDLSAPSAPPSDRRLTRCASEERGP